MQPWLSLSRAADFVFATKVSEAGSVAVQRGREVEQGCDSSASTYRETTRGAESPVNSRQVRGRPVEAGVPSRRRA
jgi:hypothetical protein